MLFMNKCCSNSIRKIHSVVVVGCMLANIAMFAFDVYIYLGVRKDAICLDAQPHTYFI